MESAVKEEFEGGQRVTAPGSLQIRGVMAYVEVLIIRARKKDLQGVSNVKLA